MKLIAIILCLATVAALTGATLLGQYKLHEIRGKCSPVGSFVEVDGHALQYLERSGGKDTIVFLHGASSNALQWQYSIFDNIPERYHLIALDRPGLGHSERHGSMSLLEQTRLIHKAIVSLELERPILVAHSLAGVIAARLLTDYPSKYRGLVLIAGVVYPVGSGASWYTRLATAPLLGHIFRYAVVPVFAPFVAPSMVATTFAPNPVTDDYSESTCLDLLFTPDRFLANASDLNQIRPFLDESYPKYNTINVPVSMLYGADDQVIYQFSHAGGFAYQVPHAVSIMIPDMGHQLQYFRADLLVRELDRIRQLN